MALGVLLAAAGCGTVVRDPINAADDLSAAARDLTMSFVDPDMSLDLSEAPCPEGLKCRLVTCGEGQSPTAVVGKVFAPNGTLPIYNALVYIPNADLDPVETGVSCDVCSAHASGKPIVAALTDSTGSFRLENVPIGDDVPMVIQMGRWRRQVLLPHIEPCVDNVLDPKRQVDLQRLPRRKLEGNIPLMAIAAGVYDPVECLLHKLGIDDKEFTNSTGRGRVQLYDQGGTNTMPAADPASVLYNDLRRMRQYDVIILPCSGSTSTPMQQANLAAYTDAGGRVFATDLSMHWLKQPAWDGPIDWTPPSISPPYNTLVDQSFPKGKAFARWLLTVGASQNLGSLTLTEAYGRLESTTKPVQRWLWGRDLNAKEVDYHFTFNTPIHPARTDAGVNPQCGRVLYSSFHVAAGALKQGAPRIIPGVCADGELTPQEKALAFMLFDLTSCVQTDDEVPVPPPLM